VRLLDGRSKLTAITTISVLLILVIIWFDPARDSVNNESKGITAYVNAWFYKQFRVVAEYQHKNTKRGSAPGQRDDAFQVRFVYIK